MSVAIAPIAAGAAASASGSIAGPMRPVRLCGELYETEERRRETKGGFVSRKYCQAALTRKLTALAENTYVLLSRLSLQEVWPPAIASGVRETTLGYRMLVEQHPMPGWGQSSCRT